MWSRGFILLCGIVFVVGLVTGPVQMLFPVYAERILEETALFAALLRALPIGLGGVSALIGGTFSDRFGRKPTLLIGMTGAVVVGGLFTTQTPLFLWGILCYEGIASGFKTAGGQSYLISAVPPNQLGWATGWYFISFTVGSAVGSAIAGEVIDRMGYRVFGVGAVILAGVLFVGACLFLPRLAGQQSSTSHGKQDRLWKSTLNVDAYLDLSRRRNMRMLIGLRVFPTYYWGSVNLLIPILIERIAGVKATGYYGAISLLFAFGCQLTVGRICDIVGHRAPAFVANTIVTLLAFGVAFFHDSLIALEVFGILGAGAAWSLSTTIPRFINEFTEPHEKGHGVGLTHLAWSTGFLLGYVASGFLINISVHVPFIVAGGFLIISTAIAYRLWYTKKPRLGAATTKRRKSIMVIAELDLENAEHRELTDSEWRYGDGLVPGEPNGGLVDQLPETPARLADYDDSDWPICENIQEWVSSGFCFGWYRITVTLPEEVDGVSIAGSKVWFHTCIDDYGEVWVDGEIDLAFGESGRGAASGFNAPQRVVVTESAEPGAKHVIACLAVNGPFGRPGGGIFMRFAKLEFEQE